MKTASLTVAVLLAIAGTAIAQADRVKVEDEISEALFRHQIAQAQGNSWAPEVWCIRTPNNERTSRLVLRLMDIKSPVLNAAECMFDLSAGVRERDSGKIGRSLWIKRVVLESESAASVTGGYYVNGTNSAGVLFTLRHDGAKWVVVEGKTQWVS
jgi:hypothetical protein